MSNFAFSKFDRKAAIVRLGLNQSVIAGACKVDRSLVSHVIAGRRWMGKDARRVMEYIAEKVGAPLEIVFPGSNRRKGEERRDRPFDGGTDRRGRAAA